jgi:hypothetical protein
MELLVEVAVVCVAGVLLSENAKDKHVSGLMNKE